MEKFLKFVKNFNLDCKSGKCMGILRPTELLMKVKENNTNGDCLFESIMQFLKHQNIQHTQPVNEFRTEIVEFVMSDWDKFHCDLS